MNLAAPLPSIVSRRRNSVSMNDRTRAAALAVEAAWADGQGPPSIEGLWASLAPDGAVEVLAALIKADLRCRFERAEAPYVASYLDRFAPPEGGPRPRRQPRLRGILPPRGARRAARPRLVRGAIRPLARLAAVAAPVSPDAEPGRRGRGPEGPPARAGGAIPHVPAPLGPGPGRVGVRLPRQRRGAGRSRSRAEAVVGARDRGGHPGPSRPRPHRAGPLGDGRPGDRAARPVHALPPGPAPGRGDPSGRPRGPAPIRRGAARPGRRPVAAQGRRQSPMARLPRARQLRRGGRLAGLDHRPRPGLRALSGRPASRRQAGQRLAHRSRGSPAPGLQPRPRPQRRRPRRGRAPGRHPAVHGPGAAPGVRRPRPLGRRRGAGRRLRHRPPASRDADGPTPLGARRRHPAHPRDPGPAGSPRMRVRAGPGAQPGRPARPGGDPRPVPGRDARGPLCLGDGPRRGPRMFRGPGRVGPRSEPLATRAVPQLEARPIRPPRVDRDGRRLARRRRRADAARLVPAGRGQGRGRLGVGLDQGG